MSLKHKFPGWCDQFSFHFWNDQRFISLKLIWNDLKKNSAFQLVSQNGIRFLYDRMMRVFRNEKNNMIALYIHIHTHIPPTLFILHSITSIHISKSNKCHIKSITYASQYGNLLNPLYVFIFNVMPHSWHLKHVLCHVWKRNLKIDIN